MKPLAAVVLTVMLLAGSAHAQWEEETTPVTDDLYAVDFVTPSIGYAVGWGQSDGGVVLKTTNGGRTWTSTVPLPNTLFFDVEFEDAMIGRVSGYNGFSNSAVVFTTEDGGDSWFHYNLTESFGAYVTTFPSESVGYTCGYDGAIFNTTDGGNNWWLLPTNTTWVFRHMQAVSVTSVYAVAGSSFSNPTRLFYTADAGDVWEMLYDFSPMVVGGIYMHDDTYGIAVGTRAGSEEIRMTSDGGESWEIVLHSDFNGVLQNVHFNGAHGYAVGTAGRIWRSDDSGQSWELEDTVDVGNLLGVFQTEQGACAVGSGGSIFLNETPLPEASISLIPTGQTVLPVEGGTLEYDVRVVSNLGNPVPGMLYWTKVQLPNGTVYPTVLQQVPFTLWPQMDVFASLEQNVPAGAPEGDYEFIGHIGFSPDGGPQVSNSFPFTKLPEAGNRQEVGNWSAAGPVNLRGVGLPR